MTKTHGVTEVEKICANLSKEIYFCDHQNKRCFDAVVINGNAVAGIAYSDNAFEGRTTMFVAHQGTNDGADGLSNITTGKKAIPGFTGRARKGFYNHSRKTWRFIRREIKDKKPDVVVFTGHSLGGAACSIQAALCVASFEFLQNTLYCVTFGAPRVFDSDAADVFNDCFEGRTTRFVAPHDPVPRVPNMAMYRHAYGRYLLKNGDSVRDEIIHPVKAVANNLWNLFKGVITAARTHSMAEYKYMVDAQPSIEYKELVSPSDGFKVVY